MKKLKNLLTALSGILLLLAGTGIFLYPVISNNMAVENQAEAISFYDKSVSSSDTESLDAALAEAQSYNDALMGDPVRDPFVPGSGYALPQNYNQVLNLNGDGIMGYLEIPEIGVRIPVAHGTSEEVMLKNLGHIESTALPIGGEGTHSVITGHRGLPSAELLTRLDEIEEGDIFILKVLGKSLAYRVDKISVVLPHQLAELKTEPGRDLVTVLTCTPYGINTHRLLVRGERTEYTPELHEAEQKRVIFAGLNIKRLFEGMLLGLLILILLAVFYVINKKIRKKRRYEK